MAAVIFSVQATVQPNFASKAAASCKKALGEAWGFCFTSITTLGARGPDGHPLALKVMMACSKIFQDQKVTNSLAMACVKFCKYAGAPLMVIGTIFAPLAGFEMMVNDVSSCHDAVQNRKAAEKVNCQVSVIGAETYKFENKAKVKVTNIVKAEKIVQATATVSGWLSDLSNAIAKIAELNFLDMNQTFIKHVSVVGVLSAKVFAYVGAAGTLVKFCLSAHRLWEARNASAEEKAIKKMAFTHASIALAKVALRISLIVFASYFSLTFQGVAALGMIAMDIYTQRTKKEAVDNVKVSVFQASAAA